MQVQVDIGFEQLIEMVNALPESQLNILREHIKHKVSPVNETESLRDFLLNGPTFSGSQIETINQTRAAINQWRTR